VVAIHRIVTGPLEENCYVVASPEGDAAIVDPGGEMEAIAAHVEDRALRVHAVLNTHPHYDHLGAVVPVTERYGVPFHLHPADADLLLRANFFGTLFSAQEAIPIPEVDVALGDGDALHFGSLEVNVIHTPGHTPGSVCFEVAGELLTGDTLLAEHVGRTDLPGGDRAALEASVELLSRRFHAHTTLWPGHGPPVALGEVAERLATLPELGR
jgi:hydroxyacylglutathione hydrolase